MNNKTDLAIDEKGLVYDATVEIVASYISERDLSDEYLNDNFWNIVDIYYREYNLKDNTLYKTDIIKLINNDMEALSFIDQLGISYYYLSSTDPNFPKNMYMKHCSYGAAVSLLYNEDLYTHLAPGMSIAHALLNALMERPRQLCRFSLNKPDTSLLN